MLQLMVVYFGPYYLFRIKVGSSYRLWATFIGFVINYAAYFAEIYRSGIQSMPVGQYEAAEILGYGKAQTFFKIILPQVIKRILPSVTNEVITLVKDTSLAFTLSVAEMFSIAKALAASQTNMMPFVAAAVFTIFSIWLWQLQWNGLRKAGLLPIEAGGMWKMNLLELNHVEKIIRRSVGFKGYFTECERGRDRVHHRAVRLWQIDAAALRDDAGDDGPRRDRIFRKESSLDGRGWQGQLCGQEGHEGDPQPVRSGIPEF